MHDIVIGIDAGTSVIKSIAFDLEGTQLASASVDNVYALIDGGGAEQNLTLTWENTAKTLRALHDKIENLNKRIAAIAVTGQGDGTWLIDEHGGPVADGLLWLDARAAHITESISASPGNRRRFELTGTGLNACQQGPQLLWLKENNPEAFNLAAHAFHCKDWLYYKLTGEIATDPSEGIFSYGDFRSRQYSDEVLDVLGLLPHRSLLPEMIEGSEVYGALDPIAASLCSLPAGTPVILGYVDVICTALGSGLYADTGNRGCSIVGSTGMHMRLIRNPEQITLNEACTGYTMCMPVAGVYAQMQSNMSATLNIDWLLGLAEGMLKNFGVVRARSDVLAMLDSWVSNAPPADLLYQPYISQAGERGPFIDSSARAGFVGLCSSHGIEHMARAVFEGLALAARDCYSAMGAVPDEILLSGGASKSSALLNIIAATLNSKIHTTHRKEAGAAGAAMMAAVAIGQYPSMDSCVSAWVDPLMGEIIEADENLVCAYRSVYPVYADTHAALQPVWQSLGAHRRVTKPTWMKQL